MGSQRTARPRKTTGGLRNAPPWLRERALVVQQPSVTHQRPSKSTGTATSCSPGPQLRALFAIVQDHWHAAFSAANDHRLGVRIFCQALGGLNALPPQHARGNIAADDLLERGNPTGFD